MKRYILISVCEREILTELFDTIEEAQETMHREMVEWGKVLPDVFVETEYDSPDFGFGEYGAFVNNGCNHNNYDWLIVDLLANE